MPERRISAASERVISFNVGAPVKNERHRPEDSALCKHEKKIKNEEKERV
jgi:hypothetical protein